MKKGYKELLDRASKDFDAFSLVWRDHLKFNKSATEIEKALRPYLLKTEITSEWPGTKLFTDAKGTLRLYKVTAESLNVLKTVEDIFSWLAPAFPEDLTFYIGDRPVYISIAHEKEAWYEGT